MSTIILITPHYHTDVGLVNYAAEQENPKPPYGVLLLGTVLREAGHQVRIIDMHREMVRMKGDAAACLGWMSAVLADMRPDIVGISFFTYFLPEAAVIMRRARKAASEAGLEPIFVAGGVHAMALPLHTLRTVDVDYVCTGEGEKAMLALAAGRDPDAIPGLASRRRPDPGPAEIVENLDDLPFVDYSLIDWKFYASPTLAGFKRDQASSTMDLLFSRGCAFACNFCAYSLNRNRRHHSADYIIANMAMLADRFGIVDFQFWDSTLGTDRRLLVEFCEKLLADPRCRQWKWRASLRANQADRGLLELMRDAGCIFLCFGFESASQKDLDRMNKRTRVADNFAAARMCNELGIYYNASFLVNYPGQTERDFAEIERFLLDVFPPAIGINSYAPLPGSEDYKTLAPFGACEPDDVAAWRTMADYSKFSLDAIYAEVDPQTMSCWYDRLMFLRDRLTESRNRDEPERFRRDWLDQVERLPDSAPDAYREFFSQRDEELCAKWQTCFYGDSAAAKPDGSDRLFRPTSAKDHAATSFVELPRRDGSATQFVRIALDFPDAAGSGGWRIEMQDEKYNSVSRFRSRDGGGPFVRVAPVVALPGTEKIRLVFSPEDMTPVRLPRSVVLASGAPE